jgi:hypothetical protein
MATSSRSIRLVDISATLERLDPVQSRMTTEEDSGGLRLGGKSEAGGKLATTDWSAGGTP